MTALTKLKVIVISLLVLLILGAIGLVSYNAYYWRFVAPRYESVSVTNVDRFKYTEDEKYFIEANHFTNELNNGIEVFEIRLNSYADPEPGDPNGTNFKNVHSYGIQIIGNPEWNETDRTHRWNWGFLGIGGGYSLRVVPGEEQTYYYNTDGSDTSFSATNKLGIDSDAWIVDFDGRIGLIKQKGWKDPDINPVITINDLLNPKPNDYGAFRQFREMLDIHSLIRTMYNTVDSLRNGVDVLQFNLSKWFEGYSLTAEGDRFETTASAHQNWLFVNVKVNRSPNGMVTSSQSIFGMVEEDSYWAQPGYEPIDYWRTNTIYNLTVSDFDFLPTADGFNAQLNATAFNFLQNFNNMQFVLVIDISNASLVNAGINLVGLAADPFRGLRMSSVLITSAFPTTFSIPFAIPNISTVNVNLTVGGAA